MQKVQVENFKVQSSKFGMKLSFTANDSSYSLRSTIVITVNDPQEMITEEEENRNLKNRKSKKSKWKISKSQKFKCKTSSTA